MSNPHRRLGRNMIWLMWLVLLGLLTLFFGKLLDRQYNPNQDLMQRQPGEPREVVLLRNKYGHYVASGLINDQPVVFLLDTGASDISIPAAAAR
ncbi:MAG TPA: TIGR02281 family clan AA aspartic protease, partial [Chromatiales bacterium]|nr:TIGR02281 family clan AA aspartic protease [Chromatiales bacterium]